MKKLLAVFILILWSTSILAHGENRYGIDESSLVGSELPKSGKAIFANQRINLYVALNSGEQEIHGLVTQKGIITEFTETEVETPTLQVYTSETVIKEIMEAENQANELQRALRDGRITYRAIGLKNKIKFRVVGVLSSIASWFRK